MKRQAFILLAILLSSTMAAGPSRNPSVQEKPQPPAPLQYEVSVILKLIHVYVTDKSGKPIVDLTKDDFALTDNGKPVTLTEFEKHILEPPPGKAPIVAPAAPAVTAVPTAPAEGRKPAAQGLLNRKFFLFFDFAFNNPRGINKAKEAALHFLDTEVRTDDEVALLTYSALKGLTVQEYLTNDRGKISKVVAQIGRKEHAGQATEVEDQYWRLVEAGSAGPDVRGEREDSKLKAESFILRLTALAKALRLIPGEKQFILFSTGIPNSLIYGYVSENPAFRDNLADAGGDRVLRVRNEEMYREFAASGCAFYVFDTRESAKVASLFTYDTATMGGGRSIFTMGGASQSTTGVFRDERTTGQNTLKRLSDITGGKYYSNINLYKKNLDEVQIITGTFYVLGYSISQEYDGRFHEVKVTVKRPGCVVRAQTGYFAPKPFADYTDLEKRLQLFDLALNERSPFRLPAEFPVTALSFPLGTEMRSELLAKIPGEITRTFTGNKVELFSIVLDSKGDISDVRRFEADLGPQAGQALLFSAGLALKPGDYDCRVIVRDMQTGMSAVASTRAALGKGEGSGLRLCTPLVLVEETGTAILDTGPVTKGDSLSWSDIYSFDRLNYSPAIGPISKVHKEIKVVAPYSPSRAGQANVTLSMSVINTATGVRTPVNAEITGITQNATTETACFELPIEDLQPGRYLLYVYAEDRESKALAHAQTAFVISGQEK